MQKIKQEGHFQTFHLFFKKALYEIKASCLQFLTCISIALNLAYNKSKLYKTLDYRSRDMLNFDFFRKVSGNSFSTAFFFEEKCFSCYILSTDQMSLPDCLYFLRYCTICVLQLLILQVVKS